MKYLKHNENLVGQYKQWLSDQKGDITESIKTIVHQISQNITSGWKGTELQASYECVTLQDVDQTFDDGGGVIIEYNGWYENLAKFSFDERIKNIIAKIDANNENMWSHSLEDTFGCVIIEDIDLEEEEEPYTHHYNGWYQDLQKLAGM